MRIKKAGNVAIAIGVALLLIFGMGCTSAPGKTPSLTPAPDEVTSATPAEGGSSPSAGESTPTPTSDEAAPDSIPEANFRLLISDDVNAIGDFESLIVTISSVGVHKAGGDGEWLELSPATEELDLVSLQGDNAQEIWSGDLPDGEYTKVFVYISAVDGTLNGGDSAEVKLPSDKLHINTNFNIAEDSSVNFVFDISVVATGNGKNGSKYILKPVISQSGPNQHFTEVNPPERERERERLRLELEGDIAIGEEVTLLVTFEDEPVAGAEVVVNDEEIGETAGDGTISFTIPEGADEIEIEVKLGELEGELELNLSEDE